MSALAVATKPADREMDDLDLVAAVRAGDDRAFEVLFRRYQPRIAAYVGGMVRDHGRAEDITQEVFMSALRRLRDGDAREIHFRPWIYEIAKNKCIDAYRRGRHANEVSFDAHDEVGAAEHGRLAEPAAMPDAAVEGKLAFDNLRGAFGGLSEVHHDILVMREFEGLSYREIGERLGMSRTAVESTLFRARKRLGEEYDELVTGKRCLRVQRIVTDAGLSAAGLRDQRRVARHLAHCQPCRRYAYLAGADIELARPSRAARVAAFLPLPAFLRRRWGGGEDLSAIMSHQATRPVAQWATHVAATVEPATMSNWVKVAVTAAAVAIAGGATVEYRASSDASPPRGAAVEHERSSAADPATSGSSPASTAAAQADAAAGTTSTAEAGGSTTDASSDPGASHAPSADRSNTDGEGGGSDSPSSPGSSPQAPGVSVGGAAGDRTPVVETVDDTPVASDGADAGRLPDVVAPPRGDGATPDRVVPKDELPRGAPDAVDVPAPARDVVGSPRDRVPDAGAPAIDDAASGDADRVPPRAPAVRANPTAVLSTLGG